MKKRIIVVEDFNTSRQIIKKTLESIGCQVDEASDGQEALKYFDGSAVDLVITDFNMPIMDGASLAEFIRSKDEYKDIPILFLTTETSARKVQRANEARITGWIKKPFDIADFKNQIQRILS